MKALKPKSLIMLVKFDICRSVRLSISESDIIRSVKVSKHECITAPNLDIERLSGKVCTPLQNFSNVINTLRRSSLTFAKVLDALPRSDLTLAMSTMISERVLLIHISNF